MPKIAVVAHSGKSLGGGLGELREVLAREGITDPLWHEVTKSRKAPRYARRALEDGAEVIFVWGGDGMVQRCVDALAGTRAVSPSCRPVRPISWRPTCTFRPTSPRRCGWACTGTAAGWIPGR
jgi:diacylglycerol kinase family enzyme